MSKKNDAPIKGLLRFTTAGSVDDGKSTLIGRLLYDSKSIFDDQMEQLNESSHRRGHEEVDLSLLTDGLRAEREQGITIDVAYRYFATPKRKFIIADTPGHVQYTRNMVTGASTANLAVILVDARNGVLEQTRRHTYIASLLQIKHIVFCINKMDLVEYSQKVYDKLKSDIETLADQLQIDDAFYIPISAKYGDNVVQKSNNMPWYNEECLLHTLETVKVYNDADTENLRFPVQYVIRPQSDDYHDYRAYAGRVAGGVFTPGQEVCVLPSMLKSRIKTIENGGKFIDAAHPGESVSLQLEDDVDVSRGNMIVDANNHPQIQTDIRVMICWFNARPLQIRSKYLLRHNTNQVRCMIRSVDYKMDINQLIKDARNAKPVEMNDIACVQLKTMSPLFFDDYSINKNTGAVVLIDESTNETMAAGMIYMNRINSQE